MPRNEKEVLIRFSAPTRRTSIDGMNTVEGGEVVEALYAELKAFLKRLSRANPDVVIALMRRETVDEEWIDPNSDMHDREEGALEEAFAQQFIDVDDLDALLAS